MTEWWTYRPADFLMFAPETYWRQFELHNQAWGAAVPMAVAVGLVWLLVWAGAVRGAGREVASPGGGEAGAAMVDRAAMASAAPGPASVGGWQQRTGTLVLAAAALTVALGFLPQRLMPIFWVAEGYAWGFGGCAACLAALALWPANRAPGRAVPRERLLAAWLLGACGVLAYPLLATLAGRPVLQAEIAGLAPDPTAVAALGWLLGLRVRRGVSRGLQFIAFALCSLWCALTAATLATLGSAQALVPLLALLVALAAAWRWR